MKKLLLLVAAVTVSASAMAQTHYDGRHDRPGMHRQKAHKVWVPAHREHGRLVRGHYVRR